MRSRCGRFPRKFAVLALGSAGAVACLWLQPSVHADGGAGTVEKIKVHGSALEGNLEGDPAERDVIVYLPPSYASQPTRHYPVVYFLHGYGSPPMRTGA